MHCFNGKQYVTVRICPFFTENVYSVTEELCNDYREKRAIKQIMKNWGNMSIFLNLRNDYGCRIWGILSFSKCFSRQSNKKRITKVKM